MRRIVLTVCGTCAGVGLLMAWPTSLDRAAPRFLLEALGSVSPTRATVPTGLTGLTDPTQATTDAAPTSTPSPAAPSGTPTPATTPTPVEATPATSTPPPAAPAPTPAAAAPTSVAPPAAPPVPGALPVTATFTGAAVPTPYGTVQVRITVAGHQLTASQAIAYPDLDGHSLQISSYAVPILDQEAVAEGSAQISMVGGATFTSTGYVRSLQDALDQAGR